MGVAMIDFVLTPTVDRIVLSRSNPVAAGT